MNKIDINIPQGSPAQQLGKYAETALYATSAEGLSNITQVLNGQSLQVADFAFAAPEKAVEIISNEIDKLLSNSGALDIINNGINSTRNIIELLEKGLDATMLAAGIVGNLTELSSLKDTNVNCVPSIKDSTSKLYASAKDIIVQQYKDAKQQLVDLYNQMICTSQDALIDNMVISINNILDLVEPLVDPILLEYTGFTIAQIRYLCNTGFQLVNMLKRVSQVNKEEIKNKAKKKTEEVKKKANEIKDNIKEEAKKKAKEQFEKLSLDLPKEEIKAKLLDWLNEQSIIIQNAFNIVLIKDMINEVKNKISKIQNSSIENLADFCNVLQCCVDIFDLFGINKDARGITIEDLNKVMAASIGMVANAADSFIDQNNRNIKNISNEIGQMNVDFNNMSKEQFNDLYNKVDQATDKISSNINIIKYFSNIHVNLEADVIQSIIGGKVMMFDKVVQMLKTLLPIIDAIKLLCKLAENYKINKEFVQSQEQINMTAAIKECIDKIHGFKDVITLKDTNFCIVRTQSLNDFCTKDLNIVPDKNGFAFINIDKTVRLQIWLSAHAIPNDLDPLKGTTLYFDNYGIEHGNAIDNTINGLDKIEYIKEFGEVYFDSKNKSSISSEILRAIKRQEDPFIKNIDIPEDTNDLETLIKQLEFTSDEIEGQQTINLSSLNLCDPVTIYDTLEGISGLSVIEFGDEYTKGNAVDYQLNVKPGDSINSNTILAYINKGGTQYPVKSIFSAGTIKDDGNNDYYHIYPNSCKRHIVITDTSLGAGSDFNIDDTSAFGERMKQNSYIYNLIINNLNYSSYPLLLNNADRQQFFISNAAHNYKNIIDDADKFLQNDIKGFDSKKLTDDIKSSKGDPNKIIGIKDQQLKIRDEIIKHQLDIYNNINNLYIKGDIDYKDCEHLAYGSQEKFDMYQVSNDMMHNYYMSLLSRIDISHEDDIYSNEFYKIISDIVTKRMQAENYDINDIISEFNKLFNDCVTVKYSDSAYDYIKKQIVNEDFSYNNILELIKTFQFKQFDRKKDKNDNITRNAAMQLTNLFLYIKQTESENKNHQKSLMMNNDLQNKNQLLNAKTANNTDIQILIRNEAQVIQNFWDDIIIQYQTVFNLDQICNDIEHYANNLNSNAEWPVNNKLQIGTYTCNLYTFIDPIIEKADRPDIDLSDVDMTSTEIPEMNIDMEDIREINQPKIGDITILDYEYWLTYFANATLFTLLPIYWADGFDIPPAMSPTKLPALYVPIAKPLFIKPLNLLIVFGIALRGIYPAPIILMVNLSSHAINALTPIMTGLEALKGSLEQTIEIAESAIPRLVDGVMNGFANESAELKKKMENFRVFSSLIKSIPVEDKALIEEKFREALHGKYDKRQVITRLSKLDKGPEPF